MLNPAFIPFTVVLDNGTEQVLNLANVQRITFCPESDDGDLHPRLKDDPPPGIVAVVMFSPEFSVTLRREDAERLLAVKVALEDLATGGPLGENALDGLLSPPSQEGGA